MDALVKLPVYDEYKRTRVKWLEEVPSHWDEYPICSKAKLKSITNKVGEDLLSVYLDKGVIRFDEVEQKRTNVTSLDLSKYQLVEVGDFVLNNQQAWRGSVGVSSYRGIVSPAYLVLSLAQDLLPNFANYLFRDGGMVSHYLISSKGVGTIQRNLYWPQLKRAPLFIPPVEEQISIANFLDQKTAQIDEAIAIKEKQISLLKERKQIIIQKAVTQGLNPDVPMKDSGVDWIGQIPEHWKVNRLKFLLSDPLKYGANESGIDYDASLPRYVRITDFSGEGKLSDENRLSLPWNVGKDYLLKDGDILLARSGATVGKSYQFKLSMSEDKNYCFAGYLIRARCDEKKILSDYLNLYLNSDCFLSWKNLIFNKATIENIGADKYSILSVIVPPIDEQEALLNYLNNKLEPISEGISHTIEQIGKLKEYKTTLINSAVTGKIKVV